MIFFLYFISIVNAIIHKENGILLLTAQNINEAILEYDHIFVNFYYPNAKGVSKALNRFSNISEIFQEINYPLVFGKYDIKTEDDAIAKNMKIFSFNKRGSWIAAICKGKLKDKIKKQSNYTKTFEFILASSLSMTNQLPNSVKLAEYAISTLKIGVIFFTDNQRQLQLFQKNIIKNKELKHYRDIKYGYSFNNSEIIQYFNITYGQLMIFRNHDNQQIKVPFDVERTKKIIDFIDWKQIAFLADFDETIYQKIFMERYPFLILFLSQNNTELNQIAKQKFTKAFQKIHDKTYTTLISSYPQSKYQQHPIIKTLKLLKMSIPLSEPQVILVDRSDKSIKKYIPLNIYSASKLKEFYLSYKNNFLKPLMISQSMWYFHENNGLVQLIGKTAESVILDNTKDVLVNFYSSSCANSKKFAPVYAKFAKLMTINQNIIVAQIDIKLNDYFGKTITQFPTVKLFKAGNKLKPVKYQLNVKKVSYKDLLMFLARETSFDLSDVQKKSGSKLLTHEEL